MKNLRSKIINHARTLLRLVYLLTDDEGFTREVKKELQKTKNAAADLGDCLSIYRTVRKLKPMYLLELGPGISTHIICKAIEDIKKVDKEYSPIFIAIEENSKWMTYHKSQIPKQYKNLVQYQQSDVTDNKDENNIEYSYYKSIPDYPYEFIHVDGPAGSPKSRLHWYSTDLNRIWERLSPNCYVMLDGRDATGRFWLRSIKHCKIHRHPFTLSYHLRRYIKQ